MFYLCMCQQHREVFYNVNEIPFEECQNLICICSVLFPSTRGQMNEKEIDNTYGNGTDAKDQKLFHVFNEDVHQKQVPSAD